MERESTENSRETKHPRTNANVLSKLFFCWTFPTFMKGYKRDLDENDLYESLEDQDSHKLGSKLEDIWIQEKVKDNPSLTRAIWSIFGKEICCYGLVLFIIEFGTKLAQPLCLGKLMQYFSNGQDNVSKDEALIYGSLIIMVSFLNALLGHNYIMGIQHLGMKIRIACGSLIYRKSLKLNNSTTEALNIGKIINMLANDLGRFDNIFLSFHNIWAAPIQIIVVTCLLYLTMGVYALAGIGFFVLFIPVQSKITSKYRLKTASKTDERINLMNEIIGGIQVIKMYTWEKPFEKLVEKARKLEIKQIRSASMVRAINASVSMFLNRTALYFAVLAYTLAGNAPQAYYVFVVTSFYNVLKQPLVFHIPQAISSLAESSVAIKRMEDFLLVEDIEEIPSKVNHDMKTVGIFCHSVSVRWNLTREGVLTDLNFSAKKNELIAIVGPVGSGKSTIFNIILRELPIEKGTLDVSGTISYSSQEPWLFAGTIRDNILFGKEMIPKRYQEVCRVCALEKDLQHLANGDETVIGDRGITLSGGQRARVNLARAVYRDADIYLLDDPLSAVDTQVGKQLYEDCISGFLRGKCVLLITHQLQYLKNVNKVYVVRNGSVKCCDTFEQFYSSYKEVIPTTNYQQQEYDDDDPKPLSSTTNKLEVKEHKQSGTIQRKIYSEYIQAGGSYFVACLIIFLFVTVQFLASSVDYFLTYWVNLEEARLKRSSKKYSDDNNNIFLNRNNCIYLYSLLIALTIFFTIIRSTSFMQACMKASKRLYHKMTFSIINTCMTFFYTNPAGRVLNRFSKDIGIIDEVLPLIILDTLQVFFNVIAVTILVAVVNPWILIPSALVMIMFYWLKKFFLASIQDLKRMESTDTMQGVATIRASNAANYFINEYDNKQNMHSSAFYLFLACNKAFGFWLDFHCVIYVGVVVMSLLLMLDETTGGNVGLAITQSLSLTGMLQWGIRQWSEMDNQMTAVERVVEYAELKAEADGTDRNAAASNWPNDGSIQFKNVCLKYDIEGSYAISNISATINPKEKVGIVGRTGAGKSSMVAALFRLVETEGAILIDNVDTKKLPLNLLRSKISIIPQEPILLHGTLRRNLDPFEEYKDDQLWAALKEVQLSRVVEELPGGLYSKVYEGGSNFSVGQKQLLCIARALVRNNKILVLDEATSSVDQETDELIQKTIRSKFKDCTVLTIAHRLRTIMDSDRVMVLSAGYVVEFDHAYNLLQNKGSAFYGMLIKTEHSEFLNLMKIAEENFKTKYSV